MSDQKRQEIFEEKLEMVNGGMFYWDGYANTMTYTRGDGSQCTYRVNNMNDAWTYSNDAHKNYVPEDAILTELLGRGYIS